MLLRVALVSAVLGAAPAWACHNGSHGHIGAGNTAIDLRFLEVLGIGIHVHSHEMPCPEVVVQAPPVVVQYAPQPQYQYVQAQPQIVYVPTPPPVVVAPTPPPVVVAAPVVVAPVVVSAAAPRVERVEGPALLAVKYMPGASGTFTAGETVGLTGITPTHSIGLELRLSRWFALRSDLELRAGGRSYDVLGGKVWLAPASWGLRPYASASLSGSETVSQPGKLAIGVVGAAGLDLNFGKHFFLEAEARYRAVPGGCCRDVPQVTAVVGGGLAFF